MVLGAYEEHVARPRREAIKRAEEAEKRLDEFKAAAKDWNRRRLKAQADGKPFDEPHPDDEPES